MTTEPPGMGMTLGKSFKIGLKATEKRNPKMTTEISNSIENIAKFTEKRLSIKNPDIRILEINPSQNKQQKI